MEINLDKQFQNILKEYSQELHEEIENGLTEAGKTLIERLKLASPVGESTPHFKDLWEMKTKYKGVRYVGNTKTIPYKNGNIPLSNILEYGPHAKPFISRTFETNKELLYSIVTNKLKGGN